MMIVTGTDFDLKASTSTCTVVGGSMSSMLGSSLTTEIGIAYVPTRVTLDHATVAVSTEGSSDCSVFWSPPTRTWIAWTGCTRTNCAGIVLCGTGTVTSFVAGGLPA